MGTPTASPRYVANLDQYDGDVGPSLYPEAKETAALLGIDLLPWQDDVLRSLFARRPDGVPVFVDALISTPRQSGKTWLATVYLVTLGRILEGGRLVYTAQTRADARDRIVQIGLESLRAGLDVKVNQGVGNELVRFNATGTELRIISPNAVGAHGTSLDAVVLDEVWACDPVIMGGIIPARVARPASQFVAISTAGTVDSELFLDLQAKGRTAANDGYTGFGYWEWSAPDDVDVHDPDNWADWMPSLGATQTVEAVQATQRILPPGEFERAFGNRTVRADQPVVPENWWTETADGLQTPKDKRLILGVEVGKGPTSASISGAWDSKGTPHIELIDHVPGASLNWLPGRLDELLTRHKVEAVTIDKGGPAGAVYVEVKAICERRGIPLRNIYPRELAAGCGILYAGLRDRELTHGQALELDNAILGARRKSIGDAWLWDRNHSTYDIAPLNAATMALYTLGEFRSRPKPKVH